MTRIAKFLDNWLDGQPEPRGEVLSGEAGCRLRRDPDTTVGIDVVYISAALAQRQSADTTLIDGVPVLVVEILSPSDTQEEIDEKIDGYLRALSPVIFTTHSIGLAPSMAQALGVGLVAWSLFYVLLFRARLRLGLLEAQVAGLADESG